jgi:hypothetical protein
MPIEIDEMTVSARGGSYDELLAAIV